MRGNIETVTWGSDTQRKDSSCRILAFRRQDEDVILSRTREDGRAFKLKLDSKLARVASARADPARTGPVAAKVT